MALWEGEEDQQVAMALNLQPWGSGIGGQAVISGRPEIATLVLASLRKKDP
jgi:hypothetical protein